MGKQISFEEHADRYVVAENGCWHWQGHVFPTGYGTFYKREHGNGPGKNYLAHRNSYEVHVGPIPEGLVLDHTCHNNDPVCEEGVNCLHRRCINPAHLEPVTRLENIFSGKTVARVNRDKTHCPQGHEYSADNTYSDGLNKRQCKTCRIVTQKRYYDSEHGGEKKRAYARERMRAKRADPAYGEYKRLKERERYWRNKAKKEQASGK